MRPLTANPQVRQILTATEDFTFVPTDFLAPASLGVPPRPDVADISNQRQHQARSADYQAHAATNFTQWRLVVDGGLAPPWHCRFAMIGAFPHAHKSRATIVSKDGLPS